MMQGRIFEKSSWRLFGKKKKKLKIKIKNGYEEKRVQSEIVNICLPDEKSRCDRLNLPTIRLTYVKDTVDVKNVYWIKHAVYDARCIVLSSI